MESINGYVKISRNILDSSLWHDAYDTSLLFFCLLRASHNKYGVLEPGQFITSIPKMMESLGWSRNCVRTHLRHLIVLGYVTTKKYYSGMILTITDWENLTSILPPESHFSRGHNKTEEGQIMTKDGFNMDPEGANNDPIQDIYQKNPKPENVRARETAFDIWWAEYPKHGLKSEALRAWNCLDVSPDTLLKALRNAKRSHEWLKENGRYIPYAVKWLDGNWEDYIDTNESEDNSTWTEY